MSSKEVRSGAILACIAGLACILAAIWAIRVPLYQEPDERAHTDYVFALFDAGRPFVVHHGRFGVGVTAQTRYLSEAVDYQAMRYNPYARAPRQYGSAAFRRAIDAGAPKRSLRAPTDGATLPYVMFLYPAAYYVVESILLTAVYDLHRSLWDGFLAMRLFNVALLAGFVVLVYATFRAYRIERTTARFATLAIAIFPLTTSMAGYVQPDNATAVFVALATYGAARWRRDPDLRSYAVVTIALCALFAVKLHYAIALWLVSVPLVAFVPLTTSPRAFVRRALCVACLPLAVGFASSAWLNPVGGLESPRSFAVRTEAARPGNPLNPLRAIELVGDAANGMVRGPTFKTFWLGFGYRGGRIFGRDSIDAIFAITTILTFAAFAAAEFALVRRIVRVARRKRSVALAIQLLFAGHAANTYLVTTAILVTASVLSNGELELEGRYWYPLLGSLAFIVLRTVFRPLPSRIRRPAGRGFATMMAAYSVLASVLALNAMNEDFYRALGVPRFESVADVYDVRNAAGEPFPKDHRVLVDRPQTVRIDGYAVDMLSGLPARDVYAEIDGHARVSADRVDLYYPEVARVFNDDRLTNTGFSMSIPARDLGPGPHELRLFVRNAPRRSSIAFRFPVVLFVGDGAR